MSEEVDPLTGLPLWKKCWRHGYVPQLSTHSLEVLRDALMKDDPRLIQGATTLPPPLQSVHDRPVEKACAVSFAGWQGEDLTTVAEVEEFFARSAFECDQRLGEPAGCRWFLNMWDETTRADMFRLLLKEVNYNLVQRQAAASN
jgi:hypothetical protein